MSRALAPRGLFPARDAGVSSVLLSSTLSLRKQKETKKIPGKREHTIVKCSHRLLTPDRSMLFVRHFADKKSMFGG